MTEDPYLIPGTETLHNVPGLTDRRQLEVFEVRASTARITQLVSGEVTIAGGWDLDHLMAHHRHIFQDVYPFAGKTRNVSISKDSPDGRSTTHFCEPVHIQEQGAHIFNDLARRNHLQGLERFEFVAGAAHVLVEVNYLHPGREGNGRAQRAFVLSLARNAGWDLDWERVDPQQHIDASIIGAIGQGDRSQTERPMAALLDEITTRLRPAGPDSAPLPSRGPSPTRGRGREPLRRPGLEPPTASRRDPPGKPDFDR